MRNKWIRSIALLVLVATLISLLGIGAFAAGSEDSAAADSGEASGTPTTEAAPTDSESSATAGSGKTTDTPTTETAPSDGEGTKPATYTLKFYSAEERLIYTMSDHVGGAFTDDEFEKFNAAMPAAGYEYWYGISDDDGSSPITCKNEELTSVSIAGNYSFYAAYLVTYHDGIATLGTEIVKSGAKPANVPTTTSGGKAITGWTLSSSETIVDPAQTAITGDTQFVSQPLELPAQSYTVSFYDYDGTKLSTVTTEGGIIDPDLVPASECLKGESVTAWIDISDDKLDLTSEIYDLSEYNILRDLELYAAWKVTYSYFSDDGTTAFAKTLVLDGQTPSYVPDIIFQTKEPIGGWLSSSGVAVDPAEQTICANVEFTGWVNPTLNTADSVAYVSGIAQKDKTIYTFEPDSALTRAQAAQLIYGLLNDTEKGPINVTFTDVSSTSWYSEPVYCLASYGLLNGLGDGKFEPKRGITRAEFVQLICNICGTEAITTASPFADVTKTTAWYYNSIMTAYQKGWITGYTQSDGTVRFERQRTITRAEAVTILNRVLGRTPDSSDKTRINSYDWRLFLDMSDNHWAFYEIMEAATGCGSTIPSSGLSAGRQKIAIGSSYYYAFVTKTGQFEAAKAGVNVMLDGKSYYFFSAGAVAPVYSSGLKRLNGEIYLLNSDGSVFREPNNPDGSRLYEYKNRLYYIQSDGSLLQNESYGVLYFGSNGAYTSGDQTLDAWINNFVTSHSIMSNSKSAEDRLYSAYIALRDYPKEKNGDGYRGYFRYDHSGKTYQQIASVFFQNARGDCENWASAMTFLARRVGCQAWIAEGKLRSGSPHAWEVIELNGKKYTFDVEQEWGRMYGYYNSGRSDRDCWKMTYAPGEYIKYGTRFSGTTYGSYWAGATNAWSPYYNSDLIDP